MAEPLRVMFLFPGRTGSSYILTLLDQHPEAFVRGELFADVMFVRKHQPWESQVVGLNEDYRSEIDPYFDVIHDEYWDLSDLCQQYYTQRQLRETRLCALKSKVFDLPSPYLFPMLANSLNLHVVRLSRRNPVKWAISFIRSFQLAEATRASTGEVKWNINVGDDRPGPTEISVPVLMQYLNDYTREQWEYRRATAGTKILSEWFYEDFLEDQDLYMAQLTQSLGLSPMRYDYDLAPQRKLTSDVLEESVANYDELRRALAGTMYERFLV